MAVCSLLASKESRSRAGYAEYQLDDPACRLETMRKKNYSWWSTKKAASIYVLLPITRRRQGHGESRSRTTVHETAKAAAEDLVQDERRATRRQPTYRACFFHKTGQQNQWLWQGFTYLIGNTAPPGRQLCVFHINGRARVSTRHFIASPARGT